MDKKGPGGEQKNSKGVKVKVKVIAKVLSPNNEAQQNDKSNRKKPNQKNDTGRMQQQHPGESDDYLQRYTRIFYNGSILLSRPGEGRAKKQHEKHNSRQQ